MLQRTGSTYCLIASILVAVWMNGGCGYGSIQQATYPVSGEVKLDGKPLVGATIVFHAIDKTKFKWEELPQGVTDANGKFSLFTYSSNDGAPVSSYNVGIALLQAAEEDGGDQVKRVKNAVKLPQKYADAASSGLTAKVEAKSTVLPVFELSSK